MKLDIKCVWSKDLCDEASAKIYEIAGKGVFIADIQYFSELYEYSCFDDLEEAKQFCMRVLREIAADSIRVDPENSDCFQEFLRKEGMS